MDFLFPMILIFGVFYFIVWRPAQTERAERDRFLSALSRDDEVVTTGGVHGRVAQVEQDHVVLFISDKVRIKIDKQAIARRASDPAPEQN